MGIHPECVNEYSNGVSVRVSQNSVLPAPRTRRKDKVELLEKILEKENMNEAYKRVVSNKGASGVDGMKVEDLYSFLVEHKAEIFESIRTRKYKPQPVRCVEIPKDNGQMRQLGIPTAVDRVIQQAISQVLTPIYEEQFSNSSYGFRPYSQDENSAIGNRPTPSQTYANSHLEAVEENDDKI